jgi:hypothetical protein
MNASHIPSLKALEAQWPGKGKSLRAALEGRCPLSSADPIIGGHGVEYIPRGHNAKSPAIGYVNMGDTYDTTLLRTGDTIRIGDWGSIVERGRYD